MRLALAFLYQPYGCVNVWGFV